MILEPADVDACALCAFLVSVQLSGANHNEALKEVAAIAEAVAVTEAPHPFAAPIERETPAGRPRVRLQWRPPARSHRHVVGPLPSAREIPVDQRNRLLRAEDDVRRKVVVEAHDCAVARLDPAAR